MRRASAAPPGPGTFRTRARGDFGAGGNGLGAESSRPLGGGAGDLRHALEKSLIEGTHLGGDRLGTKDSGVQSAHAARAKGPSIVEGAPAQLFISLKHLLAKSRMERMHSS